MSLNLPENLKHFTLNADGQPQPSASAGGRGRRLVANRLTKTESAYVRQVFGKKGVGVRAGKKVLNVKVRPLGKKRDIKAPVAIPIARSAFSRLLANLKAGNASRIEVPAGGGRRTVEVRSR